MPTVRELSDAALPWLTPVPPAGFGVCEVCHVFVKGDFRRCFSCNESSGQVTLPIERVVPISLMSTTGQLYSDLKAYKGAYASSAASLRISALIGRFRSGHLQCLLGGRSDCDVVTVVPSTRRQGRHPLVDVLARLEYFKARYRDVLVASSTPPTHREARDNGYNMTESVAGKCVLLVDDTFTSGAHLQSAASALQLAGADLTAALVVGRRFKADYSEATEAFWKDLREKGFDWDQCCLDQTAEDDPWDL